MKRTIIIALAFSALLASGCDFVRTIAGRPTAAKVEEIRQEQIRKEEERHQARLDSMKQAQQQMADSLAALEAYLLDSLSHSSKIKSPANLGGLGTSELDSKYYVVVGAFRDIANARRKQSACYDAGYPAQIVSFRNGLNAVAVCPSSTLAEAMDKFNKLKTNPVCPKDAWLLISK
jgi:cell division protein FtsN